MQRVKNPPRRVSQVQISQEQRQALPKKRALHFTHISPIKELVSTSPPRVWPVPSLVATGHPGLRRMKRHTVTPYPGDGYAGGAIVGEVCGPVEHAVPVVGHGV